MAPWLAPIAMPATIGPSKREAGRPIHLNPAASAPEATNNTPHWIGGARRARPREGFFLRRCGHEPKSAFDAANDNDALIRRRIDARLIDGLPIASGPGRGLRRRETDVGRSKDTLKKAVRQQHLPYLPAIGLVRGARYYFFLALGVCAPILTNSSLPTADHFSLIAAFFPFDAAILACIAQRRRGEERGPKGSARVRRLLA
jgi:hypothetical protein